MLARGAAFGHSGAMLRCLIILGVLAGPLHAADAELPDKPMGVAIQRSATVQADSATASGLAPTRSMRPQRRVDRLPTTRWRHLNKGPTWSRAALSALSAHAEPLAQTVPKDVADWCPGYASASLADRRAFWVGFLSALAKHESTYRPEAVGGGGRWYGLLQILPATARGYGCKAQTGAALMNGAANLSCGLRIMTRTVRRDGVIARGMRGVAADWGPFHSARKRRDMATWLRGQSYCKSVPYVRPVARPTDPVSN